MLLVVQCTTKMKGQVIKCHTKSNVIKGTYLHTGGWTINLKCRTIILAFTFFENSIAFCSLSSTFALFTQASIQMKQKWLEIFEMKYLANYGWKYIILKFSHELSLKEN